MKPSCYYRKPYPGLWLQIGWRAGRRVLRWHSHRMSDRCAAWDVSPTEHIRESVPARSGWLCDGCKWLPSAAAEFLHQGED